MRSRRYHSRRSRSIRKFLKPKQDFMAMTQTEAVAALTKTNETLVKVSNETDSLLEANAKLQEELENAGGAGGTITPELEAAIKATDARVHAIDELVADVPQPEV